MSAYEDLLNDWMTAEFGFRSFTGRLGNESDRETREELAETARVWRKKVASLLWDLGV
jgi:hypothetical protein